MFTQIEKYRGIRIYQNDMDFFIILSSGDIRGTLEEVHAAIDSMYQH